MTKEQMRQTIDTVETHLLAQGERAVNGSKLPIQRC